MSQCCEREMHLYRDLALDAASIAFLPDVHFVLSFDPFLVAVIWWIFAINDFITKSGQHRFPILVSVLADPGKLSVMPGSMIVDYYIEDMDLSPKNAQLLTDSDYLDPVMMVSTILVDKIYKEIFILVMAPGK